MNLVQSRPLDAALRPRKRTLLSGKSAIIRPFTSRHSVVRAAERETLPVQSWDIVVLKDVEGNKPSLARVLIAGNGKHTIELLQEESTGEFAATGIEKEIKATDIIDVITDFDYKQIQVDRSINPHMEHAEEIFTIPITSLEPYK